MNATRPAFIAAALVAPALVAKGLLWCALFAGLATTPPTPLAAAEMTVSHAAGQTALPDRPRRVLVFDPAALDTLDALGVEVTGVPGVNLPDYLAKYRDDRYLKIGTLFEPDYEAVAAAKPDLIIVGGRTAAKLGELQQIAPTIDLTLGATDFMAGAKHNVELLGQIFDKKAQARALIARIDATATRARTDASGTGRVLMVMVNGGRLTAYGPGSRFGWVHDDLGVKPAMADLTASTHGEVISFEFVLKTDPDWLLVLDRDAAVGSGGTAARQVLDNDLIAATSAAKEGRILYVDPARWYITGGGGAALATVTEELADAFEAKRAR